MGIVYIIWSGTRQIVHIDFVTCELKLLHTELWQDNFNVLIMHDNLNLLIMELSIFTEGREVICRFSARIKMQELNNAHLRAFIRR